MRVFVLGGAGGMARITRALTPSHPISGIENLVVEFKAYRMNIRDMLNGKSTRFNR